MLLLSQALLRKGASLLSHWDSQTTLWWGCSLTLYTKLLERQRAKWKGLWRIQDKEHRKSNERLLEFTQRCNEQPFSSKFLFLFSSYATKTLNYNQIVTMVPSVSKCIKSLFSFFASPRLFYGHPNNSNRSRRENVSVIEGAELNFYLKIKWNCRLQCRCLNIL